MQAEVNIGMVGHVDHGKTSLTRALTGKWTSEHSEELKRGITIRIGYADTTFYKTLKGKKTIYSVKADKASKPSRTVSFLDAPGHETLMTTAIAASSIIDGAILVIAANEKCPQPQTLEHLLVLDILGIKNIVVVQNKIDLIQREKAIENYKEIKHFLKGTVAESAPIIPISANYETNLDVLIDAIETHIPTPKRDLDAEPRMYVTRSFDINKPGAQIPKITGGIIGGSVLQGKFKVGDEIELKPGITKKIKDKETVSPIKLKITGIRAGNEKAEVAIPGGLIAIETLIDPSLAKGDGLVGNLVGLAGKLPPVVSELTMEFNPLNRPELQAPPIKLQEPLVISAGTATTLGVIIKQKGKNLELKLKRGICVDKSLKLGVCRRINQRWRLSGWGKML